MLRQSDARICVEQYLGQDVGCHLTSAKPIALGERHVIRYEHDGTDARLFVDGVCQASESCPPPAPWTGTLMVGNASGKAYHFTGLVGDVRIESLPAHR